MATKITWSEKAFQFDTELWRVKTKEGMVTLGKNPDNDFFSKHRFDDEGGEFTHISRDEAQWLTLELIPEMLGSI